MTTKHPVSSKKKPAEVKHAAPKDVKITIHEEPTVVVPHKSDSDKAKLETLLKAAQEYKVCVSCNFDLSDLEAFAARKLAEMK